MSCFPSGGVPDPAELVSACRNAGLTSPCGTVGVTGTTSAECGRFWSAFLNCSTTVQCVGTLTVRWPEPNPSKFIPPLADVRPATSVNVALCAALSARSQPGSTLGWLACAASPRPTMATATKPTTQRIAVTDMTSLQRWSRLEQQPVEDVERVVFRRGAAEPVVIGRRAIELRVEDILELQPPVLPRHDIDFRDDAGRVRASGAASRQDSRRIQAALAGARRGERRHGERIPVAD